MSYKFQNENSPRIATNYHPIELNENSAPYMPCWITAFGILYFTKWKRTVPRGYAGLLDSTLAILGGYGWAYAMVHAKKKAAEINNNKEEQFAKNVALGGAPPFPIPNV